MPARASTTKRITYRRAGWIRDAGDRATLQARIETICERRRRANDRLIPRGEGGCIFLNRWEPLPPGSTFGGVQGELVAFTEGRPAEIAHTRLLANATVDVEAQKPETGQDFVEGRAFFVVTGDHAVVSSSGSMRDSSISFYLEQIMKMEFGDETLFQLAPVMNLDKAQAIQRYGVKSIEFGLQMYGEMAERIRRKENKGLAAKVVDFVYNQVSSELTPDDIARLSDLQFEVVLDLKGRRARIGQEVLGNFARRIASEAEADYVITLGNTMQVRPNEIVYSKKVNVPLLNEHLDHAVLWEKMQNYLVELEEMRALHV